jgi:hypothetical protein
VRSAELIAPADGLSSHTHSKLDATTGTIAGM